MLCTLFAADTPIAQLKNVDSLPKERPMYVLSEVDAEAKKGQRLKCEVEESIIASHSFILLFYLHFTRHCLAH